MAGLHTGGVVSTAEVFEVSRECGIAVAVGPASGPRATVRIEYPMAMVDQHLVELIRQQRLRLHP